MGHARRRPPRCHLRTTRRVQRRGNAAIGTQRRMELAARPRRFGEAVLLAGVLGLAGCLGAEGLGATPAGTSWRNGDTGGASDFSYGRSMTDCYSWNRSGPFSVSAEAVITSPAYCRIPIACFSLAPRENSRLCSLRRAHRVGLGSSECVVHCRSWE